MRDLSKLDFNPTQEHLVEILQAQTQNSENLFFRLTTAYFFTKLASMMRTFIKIPGRDIIPVSMYVINLSLSGSGKGHSINIIEDQVINGFRDRFLNQTFPLKAEMNLDKISIKRANKKGTDPATELEALKREFIEHGELAFSFDSATTPAVKQMRHKLLLANAGSMNMELDEIGSNILGNADVLTTFLELFDLGKVKQKLIKSTKENVRTEQLFGMTPTNMLLFGTPTKLLNGSKIEEEFYEMLETGYARRCFFGYSRNRSENIDKYTAEQIYDIFTDTVATDYLLKLSSDLADLADPVNFNTVLEMSKDVTLEWINYKLHCEKEAAHFSEYEEIKAAELKHRHFKVAKLAAAYAFIDKAMTVTEDHLYNAIALAEQSGDAFHEVLNRDRAYVKLASYICSIDKEVTQADLIEDLPFYKGSEAQKRDMLTLAVAHGYKNNMIIKRESIDGIDFFNGSSLAETDLKSIIVSYSTDIVHSYTNQSISFKDDLYKLVQQPNYHWVSHHLKPRDNVQTKGGYRNEACCKPGFNLIVLDVDSETSYDTAKLLLNEYMWLMHTTKSHTADVNRYRIILPISHVLEFDSDEFKEFMENVYTFLPFNVDTQTNQRSRKWETHHGLYDYNDGTILNALQFIPKTKIAEEIKTKREKQTNMSALEQWFTNQGQKGNRNNSLMRYAFALIDLGYDISSVQNNVLALNSKLDEPLDEAEVLSTIVLSASRKINTKN